MRRPSAFVEHLEDLLAPLGPVVSRRMFGGWGFYLGDLFFALADEERLWLKVDGETREAFLAAGSEPFVYERAASPSRSGRREVSLSYYAAPDAALETPEDMLPWARRAIEAARRARLTRRSRPPARRARPKAPGSGRTRRSTGRTARPPGRRRRRR